VLDATPAVAQTTIADATTAALPVAASADAGARPAPVATPAPPPAAAAPDQAAAAPTGSPAGNPQGDTPDQAPDRAPAAPAGPAASQQAAPPAQASAPAATSAPPVDVGQAVPVSLPTAPAPTPAPAYAEPRAGVLLSEAAETVRLTISAANRQGVSRARIAIRPAELGGIEIMLAHGPTGLSATLTADSAQAAHAMQRAADELQRTLADQGLNLVSLKIGVAADGAAARGREDRDAPADDSGTSRHAGPADHETDDPTVARTLELPNGVLVDVLA
jgi:flagellar hook-length control protein FliK